ncbi:MAG: SPOR domain-containing protein [Burkholderiaceae bacterium]|nr:SPOR domain-containing protein [Burkholderiaceae bacterium]
MLKFLFWTLLAANLGLFAYQQGYLNPLFPDGREPARLAQQVHADKIRLIPANAAGSTAAPSPATTGAAETPAAAAAAPSSTPILACVEIGDFDSVGAKRFETQLVPLALGNRLSKHDVQDARNIVYIPSQGSKEGADKKAGELRHLGINEFYVMQDAGEFRWAISLGVFKTEEAARAQLAVLTQKGVHSAKLGTRSAAAKFAYQLRDLDAAGKAGFDKLALDFPAVAQRDCAAASSANNSANAASGASASGKASATAAKGK